MGRLNVGEWGLQEWLQGIAAVLAIGATSWAILSGVDPSNLSLTLGFVFWFVALVILAMNVRMRRKRQPRMDPKWTELAKQLRASMRQYPPVAQALKGVLTWWLDAEPGNRDVWGEYLKLWRGGIHQERFMRQSDDLRGAISKGEFALMGHFFAEALADLIQLHTLMSRLLMDTTNDRIRSAKDAYAAWRREADTLGHRVHVELEMDAPTPAFEPDE